MNDQCKHCPASGMFDACESGYCDMSEVCEHGSLKRQCLVCELQADLDAARCEADNLKNELIRAKETLAEESSNAHLWTVRCKQAEAELADARSHVTRLLAENQRLEREVDRSVAFENALREIIKSQPCTNNGDCFYPVHDYEGNYVGERYVDPLSVLGEMVQIAQAAIEANDKPAAAPTGGKGDVTNAERQP